MNNIFVYTQIEQQIEASGEAKKAQMQINAFNALGLKTEIYYNNIYSPYYKIKTRLPFYPLYGRKTIHDVLTNISETTEFVYIRRYYIDRSLVSFAKKIKECFPNVKVIFEIPTFPYDGEMSRLIDAPKLWKERSNRNQLKKYVDRVVLIAQDEDAFGMKHLTISNGIDVNTVKQKTPQKLPEGEIHLLAVALFQKSHGYERIIEGLANYYKEARLPIVHLELVGEGTELPFYKKLVDQYGLGDYVHFHGKLANERLDSIFEQCQIGLSVLGWYKIGISVGSPLKTQEYCARGLPFVYGYEDQKIDKNFPYALQVSNDDTPVDIGKIVAFYDRLKETSPETIINKMRCYAEDHLSWKENMRPVADYIIGGRTIKEK